MRRLALLAVPATAGLLDAGCGSGANAASPRAASKPTATATAAPGGRVTVTATEFAFDPAAITAKAGTLTLTLRNAGKVPHELVVLKTDQPAGALAVAAGRVAETTSAGEMSETEAGASKTTTLTLKPGRYGVVCNIPGHHADGMRGTLTVR